MTGTELRDLLETLLPEELMLGAITAAGFQERQRKLRALLFLRAMVLAAASSEGGRQASVFRLYIQAGAPRVARASFYDWFGPALAQVMAKVSAQAMAYAAAQPVDLPGFLGCVRDWRIVDSTTVILHPALAAAYPGTGDYAALKVHKTLSVGCGATVAYHLSPAREHDSKHLTIDESWRGYGLLADLGYASLARLRECETHGVPFVIRLKENWQPRVQRITRGEVTSTFVPDTDFDLLLSDEVLLLDGKVVDAQVTVGDGPAPQRLRLVGVPLPETGTYGFYLTNLPATIGPRQVADLYRIRWEIESHNKLDKACHRLDDIQARKPEAAEALVHATMIASIIACLIAHRQHLAERRPARATVPRPKPPIHPQRLARMVGVVALELADLMYRRGTQYAREGWKRYAEMLIDEGRDPNWRRRPSILDQLRGWPIAPGAPPKARCASKSAHSSPSRKRANRS